MIAPITVHDPGDPRVAAYRAVRERDLVGRQGRFVAEGKVVLDVLLGSKRFAVESVLVLESRLAGTADTLAMAAPETPIYAASPDVMNAIAGFNVHRGLLAIGLRGEPVAPGALLAALSRRALVVVPVGIANHDNIGAIFRNAAAFGADAVLLDRTSCDPLYRKAIRVSVGAALKVPFAIGGDPAALAELLHGSGFDCLALSPSGHTDIADIARPPRLALFVGTEGAGLAPGLMAAMTTARIAIRSDFDSLNVAAATAVALHRLAGA